MSISINFTFTQKGQAAVFNAQKTGTALNLTHIQLGSGNKAPAGTELALVTPQQVAAIAAGSSVSTTQIRMSAIFGGTANFNIGEIGLWSGDPAVSTSILVAYWSQASGFLAVKSNGVDFVLSHDMVLNTAVPPGSITILADQAQSAMLAAINNHQAAADPHPQYTTDAEVLALIEARVGDYVVAGGTANAITAVLVPAITSYNANTSLTFKAAATNTAATTLDAGGGAKPLVREDGTPMQAGDILAGMVVTVVYDVATTSFRSMEMVQSQVAGQIAQAAQTQANTACATAGTAPAFTASPTPQVSALGANVRLRVKFHAASVGAATLNVNGLGAKSIKQYNQAGAKTSATIFANQLVDVEYDGVDFVLLNPVPAGFSAPFISYGSATTLTDAAFGKAIALYGTSAYTVTLPVSTAANAGGVISFTAQQGRATLIISGQSGQTIQMNGSAFSSVQFGVGDHMTLVSGGGGWYVVSVSGIGVGQRWQDVTASRALATNYTNTTGRPIMVSYQAYFTGLNDISISVDDISVNYTRVPDAQASSGWGACTAIVPPGGTYSVQKTTANSHITPRWVELR